MHTNSIDTGGGGGGGEGAQNKDMPRQPHSLTFVQWKHSQNILGQCTHTRLRK